MPQLARSTTSLLPPAEGDVAVSQKWWEGSLEQASADAYDAFMAGAGIETQLDVTAESPALAGEGLPAVAAANDESASGPCS